MKNIFKNIFVITILVLLGYCTYKSVILCFPAWPFLLTAITCSGVLYFIFIKNNKKEKQLKKDKFDEFLIK